MRGSTNFFIFFPIFFFQFFSNIFHFFKACGSPNFFQFSICVLKSFNILPKRCEGQTILVFSNFFCNLFQSFQKSVKTKNAKIFLKSVTPKIFRCKKYNFERKKCKNFGACIRNMTSSYKVSKFPKVTKNLSYICGNRKVPEIDFRFR